MTFNQLFKNLRKHKTRTDRRRALAKSPQKQAICIRIYRTSPKKPNSARRPVARVEFVNRFKETVHIPGIGYNLQKYAAVLIRGGRVPDLPGVKYKIIRGKYDCGPVIARLSSRSKYGVKNWYKKLKFKLIK